MEHGDGDGDGFGVRFYGHMREARFDYKTNDRPNNKNIRKAKQKLNKTHTLHYTIWYGIIFLPYTYYIAYPCVFGAQ